MRPGKQKMNNKQTLKENLQMIEIEIFSYCNRKCWFCPNSVVDRMSYNTLLPEETYLSILNQLQEIDYDGYITYSRYNEPTSHKELFLKRIRQAREILPKALLKTNTNGDYLTREYIEDLCEAGFDELYIQQYLGNDEKYDHERMRERAMKKIAKLDLPYAILVDIPGAKLEFDLKYKNMKTHIRARNFDIDGSSRGDSVDAGTGYQRTQRCIQPFNNMYIDYNGTAMVCCALRSDIPDHKSGVMGSIHNSNLADIFVNELYIPWREHLRDDGPKSGFCKTCKDGVEVDYEKVLKEER